MALITIDTTALTIAAKKMATFNTRLQKGVDRVMNANIKEIEATAKRLAPADRGFLRQNISSDTDTFLEKKVTVNAPYAAYVEFGTGKLAAQYVATLPADWQSFAAQFKGAAGGGNFKQFVLLIAEWIGRKGISGVYSVKTRRRLGNKAANAQADLSLAYVIARSIYMKGVNPHPYLYPAYAAQSTVIVEDLKNMIQALKL
jgi:hypothetical protein